MDDDVDMLVPPPETDQHVSEWKESVEVILRTFFRIGMAQILLGLAMVIGDIMLMNLSDSWCHSCFLEDFYGQGIWGGIPVMICGSLAITSTYHQLFGVVIASLVINLLSVLLLLAGIVLAVISILRHSTYYELSDFRASVGTFAGFTVLNCISFGCVILGAYMAIVYTKIIHVKRVSTNDCSLGTPSQDPSWYKMAASSRIN